MFSKRRVAALTAEFLGTGILAFVILTVSRSQIGIAYFVALAAGLTIVALGLALQRDVQLNPAYTLGLWTARRIPTLKAVLFIVMQLLGGFSAYLLFKYFSRGAAVQELPTDYDARILVAEALGAFVFTFAAAGALYQRLHWLVRPVVTGGAYAIGIIIASAAAAGFINPSVALANNAWAWTTYILGPVVGAVVGVNLYGLLFAPRAESARKAAVANKPVSVRERVEEDAAAVPAGRLDKVEKAEAVAKADKSRKSKKKK